MLNQEAVKKLLKKYHLQPNKYLGQNFLVSQKVLQKIIQAADIKKSEIVLEIGPGLGILTQALAQKAKKVIAVEKDPNLIEPLKDILKDYQNIELIHGDILKIWPKVVPLRNDLQGMTLVANIPYYLTSILIRKILETEKPPCKIILLIQKEVAQRICAQPPKMNLLAVSAQFYSQPKIIAYVAKESFWPQPKVDSAIIKISNIKKPRGININNFFKFIKAGFSAPRKQLANNLSEKLNIDKEVIKNALTQCGLNPQVRAGDLSVENWIILIKKAAP